MQVHVLISLFVKKWDERPPQRLVDGYCFGYLNTIERKYSLKKIKTDNVSIDFTYEGRKKELVWMEDSLNSMEIPTISRLKSIVVKDINSSSIVKTCTFDYAYANSSPINPAFHSAAGRPVLFLKKINISGEGSYNLDYYDEEKSFPLIGQGIDHWGYFNQTISPTSLPRSGTDNVYREAHESQDDRYPNFKGSRMGMLKTIVYPTGGMTKLYYESHDYSSWVAKDLTSNNLPYLKQEWNKEAGGVRIKRITDYSTETDSTYREFIYCLHNNGDLEESSGILLHPPRYFRKTTNLVYDYRSVDGFPLTQKVHSPYGNFLHTEDRTHIGYSEIAERFPDGTYWLYEFSDY